MHNNRACFLREKENKSVHLQSSVEVLPKIVH